MLNAAEFLLILILGGGCAIVLNILVLIFVLVRENPGSSKPPKTSASHERPETGKALEAVR
jgi:hypothetical protein